MSLNLTISFLQYKFKTKHIDLLELFNKYFNYNFVFNLTNT